LADFKNFHHYLKQIFGSSAEFLDDMPGVIKFYEVMSAFSQLVLASSISFDIDILEKKDDALLGQLRILLSLSNHID